MKTIGITGGSGFVGGNLAAYLEKQGLKLRLISRAELLTIDEKVLEKCDALVHLAGKAHDIKKTADPAAYYEVNFELTKRVYDAFLASAAEKFIFLSSVKASADSQQGVLTEEHAANPKTDYGKSKLMAEEYIKAQPLPPGKSYCILRPCMIHGPGNKGNLNLLYKFVKTGIPYPLAAFKNKRSFLSVDNLCVVISTLLQKDIPNGVYQVADDEALSTHEVVAILAQALGKKARTWAIPVSIINGMARVGDRLKLPLNTERLQKLTENYVVSNAKLNGALGIQLPLSAKEGLMITAKSFIFAR